jgi:hypothetical protein
MTRFCSAVNGNGRLQCDLPAFHYTYTHHYGRAVTPATCGHSISVYPYVRTAKCGRKTGHHGPHMLNPSIVETKTGTIKVHDETQCLNDAACVIHDPSNHHMRDWPMTIRLDKKALVERQCSHGTGHPDPDSLMFFRKSLGVNYDRYALAEHGCDGCCTPPISA